LVIGIAFDLKIRLGMVRLGEVFLPAYDERKIADQRSNIGGVTLPDENQWNFLPLVSVSPYPLVNRFKVDVVDFTLVAT
jgi:hypothetical protein